MNATAGHAIRRIPTPSGAPTTVMISRIATSGTANRPTMPAASVWPGSSLMSASASRTWRAASPARPEPGDDRRQPEPDPQEQQRRREDDADADELGGEILHRAGDLGVADLVDQRIERHHVTLDDRSRARSRSGCARR